MMQAYVLAFIIAVAVAYFATPHIKELAIKAGAMDAPDERKVHKEPIPRMGGLAIYLAAVAAIFISMKMNHQVLGIILGGTVMLAVGVIDDIKQLSAKVKLMGQIIAALVLVAFDVRIEWLTNPFGSMVYLGYLSIPITILWVVAVTNTVNLIDGLDGLAAGVSSIASITILIVALQQNLWIVAILTAAIAGSAVGFLFHNFNPAKIFMGDTGSLFLGYMLSAVSIMGAVKGAATIALVVPIVALGLPIMDTTFAILRRYLNGVPIFRPDKGHLHHRLLAMGLTQKQVVLSMYVISGLLGISAILLSEVSQFKAFLILMAIATVSVVGAKKIGVLDIKEKNVDA
jgi:UDP-GlcNAc:undecaprenyl-phosphate/decaprenyl-phosphate GlcNAc-1-phosphate transferase